MILKRISANEKLIEWDADLNQQNITIFNGDIYLFFSTFVKFTLKTIQIRRELWADRIIGFCNISKNKCKISTLEGDFAKYNPVGIIRNQLYMYQKINGKNIIFTIFDLNYMELN
jgi:hypothetical protein